MIVIELNKETVFVFESLSSSISSVIENIYLYREKEKVQETLRKSMTELEENNEKLSNLSLTDELTGLYNRRGFLNFAIQQHYLNHLHQKESLMLFFDVDGLKKVNDIYGHKEGDWIIKTAGEVIQKTFRDIDIIARLGGDEFTVFSSNTGIDLFPVFKNRMEKIITEVNITADKPYKLSISVGAVECIFNETYTLDEYIRQADEQLYQEKRAKKQLGI